MSVSKAAGREQRAIEQYNRDIENMAGYIYTGDQTRKSMDIFNRRASASIQNLIDLRGKSIVDIGCGDGTFTAELVTRMGAASAVGVDPSNAWELGRRKYAHLAPALDIRSGNAYALEFPDKHFDVALMRGVVHHLDDPFAGLREMARVAKNAVLLEPNGYNPIIALLNRFSPYHRAHGEAAYAPVRLRRWFYALGGKLRRHSYTSLVPLLCPDKAAVFLDRLSNYWERLPWIPRISCGLYTVHFSFDAAE